MQKHQNLVSLFLAQAKTYGNRPFLWAKKDDVYRSQSWNDISKQIQTLARGLKAKGIKHGDRVVLAAENRPEWLIADLAIMSLGAITVPSYTTNTIDDHLHVIENSGAKGIIVSTERLANQVLPAAHRAPEATFVITMDNVAIHQSLSVDVLTWETVMESAQQDTTDIFASLGGLARTNTACIIYTSGTGGTPKGVMLSHGAILCNVEGIMDHFANLCPRHGEEVFLSFLPLSHSYEHTAGQFFPISIGAQIYYAEGIETLGVNMTEAHPTIMTAVPRLYETLRARIMRGVEKAGGGKEKLFNKTLALGTKRYHNPQSLGLAERFINSALSILVRKKVAGRFGGRLKCMISGGAPLNPDVGIFFSALGVNILQGYGQTEAAPVISANLPSSARMHTVGPALSGVEVKIAEDGEILVRGELVMQGYWRDDENTAKTIQNGWLHTGDIGHIDANNHLLITDRKKDLIVNSGGDNIAPQRIEGILTLEPEIIQAMVYGDKQAHLVALLIPDPEWTATWANENNKTNDLTTLASDTDFKRALDKTVSRVNADLSKIEKIRNFVIGTEPFSIDNGQMTPTMKVKRHVIKQLYGKQLDALYH